MPEVYIFANGQRTIGPHADDVAAALGVLHFRGGEIGGGSEPEIDMAARLILAYEAARDRRESEARSGARRRESSERIAADLATARQRAAMRLAMRPRPNGTPEMHS